MGFGTFSAKPNTELSPQVDNCLLINTLLFIQQIFTDQRTLTTIIFRVLGWATQAARPQSHSDEYN